LDTEILEWESWLVADKELQPRKRTFHPRQNKLRKGTGILMLALKKESSVRDVVHSVVTKNKRFLVLE
jgi:hypothetical protein